MFNLNNPQLEFSDKAAFALADHLGLLNNLEGDCLEDIATDTGHQHYGEGVVIECDGEEWAIYQFTSEAEAAAKEDISQLLWAFNASFLSSETGINESVFEAIQANDQCEGNNDAILSTIKGTCGINDFIESAISCDGMGHFLSSYDGNEVDLSFGEDTYIAFRIN